MKNEDLKEIRKILLGGGSGITLIVAIYLAIVQEYIISFFFILIATLMFSFMMASENKKKMNNLIIALCTVCLLWIICIDKVEIPNDTKKITVSYMGGPLLTFSYTDESKINNLIEYFNSLNPRYSIINPENAHFSGSRDLVIVESSKETIKMQISSSAIKMPDGKWRNISSRKANEFTEVLKENIPDEMPQNDAIFRDMEFDKWYSN